MKKKTRRLHQILKASGIARRDFIKKITLYAGSMSTAIAFTPSLEGKYLKSHSIEEEEKDLFTGYITYPGENGEMRAYMARPKKKKKYPAVIVIHENRGLNPHIENVNRRMAKEGFLSIAPDALSQVGGTPANDEKKAIEMLRELKPEQNTKNFVAAVKYLETHPLSNGKVGCTGFCWGGAMTNQVAVNSPGLDAAVPYYGRQPAPEDVAKIKAPLMAHYGGNDEGINKGIPEFEEALKKNNINYKIYIYEGAEHSFNNDSNPSRYHEQAAKLAWQRTVNFFKEYLK